MTKPAARIFDLTTAHSPCPPGMAITGSSKVLINNRLLHCVDDSNIPHGFVFCVPHVTKLVVGSSKVQCGGKPVGRIGDAYSCGIKVATGSANVLIGG
jgi:uncharacterized Zn-binding protein involved in type VI secretion